MTDETQERDALRASLEESVKDGYIEIIGEKDGEPVFSLTDKGTERVHELLAEAFGMAVRHFAAAASVAEWMAQDLLISYAADLKSAIDDLQDGDEP